MMRKYIAALCAACLSVLISFSCFAACSDNETKGPDKGPGQGTETPDDTGDTGNTDDTDEPENPGGAGDTDEPENPGGTGDTDELENPGGTGDTDEPENPGGTGDTDEPETPGGEESSDDDKNYADVFIFMGQSNMSGQGKSAEAVPCGEGHGYEFRAVSGNDEDGWLYPVEEPFGKTENNEIISDQRTGGMVSAFCESYYQNTGMPVVAVSASISGSSILKWLPGEQDTAYDEAVRRLNACLDYLEEKTEYDVRHTGMVWCQGETDAYNEEHNEFGYCDKLTYLYESLNEDAGVERCFIVTPSMYTDNSIIEHKRKLIEKQVALCEESEDFVLVSRKFENVPLKLRLDPHFYQGVYNVCGWEAGRNAALFFETGMDMICGAYAEGEAEQLAAEFDLTLSYNPDA